ncbi:hypothetical protein V8C42DRAFT_350967 [Trichoderma barbatum]
MSTKPGVCQVFGDVYPAISPLNEEIKRIAHGKAVFVTGAGILTDATDVSCEIDARNLLQKTVENLGKVDVIHCAGLHVLESLEFIGDAPIKGILLVAQELVRVSANNEAAFIQTGTAASCFASPQQSPYTSPKLPTTIILSQLHDSAMSKVLRLGLHIYAKYTSIANFLRNRFVVANWDVAGLKKHQDLFKDDTGPAGHRFKSYVSHYR